jgi:hypothetical protein
MELPTVEFLPEAGPHITNWRLITPTVPITVSQNWAQRIFHQFHVHVGDFNTKKYRLVVSGEPNRAAPIVVGDALMINGRQFGGFVGVEADPKRHVGQDPMVAYRPVDAIDITEDLRDDGHLFIQLLDLGGYTYAASQLYLVALKR